MHIYATLYIETSQVQIMMVMINVKVLTKVNCEIWGKE